MEKKARFGTGEGHTVLDKDNFAVPERNVLPHSGKGVQLPFQTTPDSPRVIPGEKTAKILVVQKTRFED